MKFRSFYKFIVLFSILAVNNGTFSEYCGLTSPSVPSTIIGYYPVYKYNLSAGDFYYEFSSVTHIYYIAFGPNDLTNGTGPYQNFQNQYNKFQGLMKIKAYLNFKLIISILLPAGDNLTKLPPFANISTGKYDILNPFTQQFINDLVTIINNYSFDGIDIDYPNKFPCFQATQFNTTSLDYVFTQFLADISNKLKPFNKILTITAGQYPISGFDSSIISFVNIQAFYLNINTKFTSAGIDNIQKIFNIWNISMSKLVLGIHFGGIVELVNSNNIARDTVNDNLTIINETNIQYPFADELILNPCKVSSYASWSWMNLSHNLSPPCYNNTSLPWIRGFDNKSQQPYIYMQQQNSTTRFYYVSYEDPQSLISKLNFVQKVQALGIAIFYISRDRTLYDFIFPTITGTPTSSIPMPTAIFTNLPAPPESSKGFLIVGVISAFIVVSILVPISILCLRSRRRRERMSDKLIDTNNQTCSDVNRQVYSNINSQVFSDTNDHANSDTNKKVG
ncbi:glycoside hydrolase family 18 protein [Gigaspora margarita]|uniref:Glycoside hydrolase family 18 protein n=1 Tax=Gigaspora margarita TaxID=4874 RepID=A0A8H4B4U3_GIGMA|nr:glycoside hydrolase family 18 protein [Gigaspora margarita]